MVEALKKFFMYFLIPGATWVMSLFGGLDWIGRMTQVNRSLLAGLGMLLLVAAYAYQSGYKGFYRVGRKRYFFVVFIAPIIVGAVGLLVGLLVAQR